VAAVGDDVADQVHDRDLIDITNRMYGRIPKVKPVRAAAATWILSGNNILGWQNDLDAFESALYANDDADVQVNDPYNGMNIHMEWVSPESDTGKFLHGWWPNATRNVHGNIGGMKIVNAWKVVQHDQSTPFKRMLETIKADPKKIVDRCLHQPERTDLNGERKLYEGANVNLMFHGTRSVNVPGILRERLKLPKQLVGVVINGAMFGPGLYWADDWKKSAQYTSLNAGLYSSGSGQVKGRHAFMFAADVTVGNPHLAKEAHGYTSAPSGYHTVYGKGGTTKSWGGSLLNNEWIVYDGFQHQMRYLIEFTEAAKPAGRKW
jgi:Poly(ADP-ribose) polymerase catalytic domain